ncbi:hypothetical protein V6Z11_A05G381500 [Gossypium hirsutum]
MTCNLGKMFYRFHFCKTFSISFFIQANLTPLRSVLVKDKWKTNTKSTTTEAKYNKMSKGNKK